MNNLSLRNAAQLKTLENTTTLLNLLGEKFKDLDPIDVILACFTAASSIYLINIEIEIDQKDTLKRFHKAIKFASEQMERLQELS